MPTIHDVLNDTQKQCLELAEEMKAFKSSKALNQKVADNLEVTCKALQETTKAIKPFTDVRVRKIMFFMISTTIFNTVLFLAILLLVFLGK